MNAPLSRSRSSSPAAPAAEALRQDERMMRMLIETLNLTDACEDPACRRAGRCAGAPVRGMPHCFWPNRSLIRAMLVMTVELGLAEQGRFLAPMGSPDQILLAKAVCLGIDREALDGAFDILLQRAEMLGWETIPTDGRALGLTLLGIAVAERSGA